MIRGLSLTEPWATLVALGQKHWETRSWPTNYRGRLAIQSAQAYPPTARRLAVHHPAFRAALGEWGMIRPFPHGRIVAVVDLVGCYPTPPSNTSMHWAGNCRLPPEQPELTFGDYAPGRYAFEMENIRPLAEPVLCRGAQGLWLLPAEVEAAVEAELERDEERPR